MPSLTPQHRSDEVTDSAMNEGLMNGALALTPALGALYFAMKNPRFVKVTNWQSRTAMVIMPALFVFSITAEQKLNHRMREVARETEHSHKVVNWAEQKYITRKNETGGEMSHIETEQHLLDLYRRSVHESGVQIVPGDSLSLHHRAANFVAENPIKVLSSMAVPAVIWIFYGRTGKEHLNLSMKIMHTRVFGQFATVSMLLGVMGFKDFIDRNGRFITEAEAEERVQEMRQLRESLLHNLELKKQEKLQFQQDLREAHEQDLKDVKTKKKKKRKVKKAEETISPDEVVQT